MTSRRTPDQKVRILRVISRLNVGGPAIQAITVTRALTDYQYDTLLLRGREGPREGSMDPLADRLGVQPLLVESLQRPVGVHDVRALFAVARAMHRFQPHILHTHAAKAGTIGRMAALLLRARGRTVTVHTFHGHVLEGYFPPGRARLFLGIERWLGQRTDQLVAVSEEVRDDLIRLGVGSNDRIRVIPLGFELSRFMLESWAERQEAASWRVRHGIDADVPVVLLVARLVPIKRVDRFLGIARRVAVAMPKALFVVLGDGDLGCSLRESEAARALGKRLRWIGFEHDVAPAMFASSVVALTSDNEGTPVSLIEAHAAGVPAVATDVGGVRSVVDNNRTGYLIPVSDEERFADALIRTLKDPDEAARLGAAGRERVLNRFGLERLLTDLDGLYRDLLERSSASRAA